jgi:hypothetical protein
MAGLRESIEAAVLEQETGDSPLTPPPPPSASPASAPAQDSAGDEPGGEELPHEEVGEGAAEPPPPPTQAKAPAPSVAVTAPAPGPKDEAPKSWKPATKAKWAGLDPEIKAEVHRREAEMVRSFGENAQARELHKNFSEVIRPYEGRIRATGHTPLQAINELFRCDHVLSFAPMAQRAKLMAVLIKDYGIDIRALDSAIAGEPDQDPVTTRVEQMVQQQLAPLREFLGQQQQTAKFREQALHQEAEKKVTDMASDSKYPHFETVREDMADLVDLFSARGVYLTPDQAYTRAVAMNPELAAQAAAQQQSRQQRQNANRANGRAHQALRASSSVSSSPSGTPGPGSSSPPSLRDTIEAAFDETLGR